MTLTEIGKLAEPGLSFKRVSSARVFHFGKVTKKGARVYLVCDVYNFTAALFSDDLAADDWEVVAS